MPSASCQVAFVCTTSALVCAVNLIQLHATNLERIVVVVLLAGNVATSALTLAIGIDDAYSSEAVVTSNSLTHLVVAGLVLWAIRPR